MRIAALSNLAKDAQHPASPPESNRSICSLIFPELSGTDHLIWTAKFRISAAVFVLYRHTTAANFPEAKSIVSQTP
jgi:hypothetical protein